MAQKVLFQLVDDLDGTPSDEVATVRFGIDGVQYEIDLTPENAERLRKSYEDYVAVARRTGGRLQRGTRPVNKPAGASEAGAVREWAIENGYELSGRGRIPGHVIEAYEQAQVAQQAKPKAVAARKRPTTRRGATKKS
jgi:nucleoid-associated protein Lsr2